MCRRPGQRRVGILDVAAAGVSRQTVSNVLNGRADC
jgi:DNA-binding LacI/PurR family transcriptional regulator